MKILIIVPKKDERIGGILTTECQDYEVEVPDNAVELHISYVYAESSLIATTCKKIPLPHKQKVKKNQWVVFPHNWTHAGMFDIHRTETEIKAALPNAEWYHKIPETEIEVEE